MFTLYAHINKTNGKAYIGITSRSVKERWRNGEGYSSKNHMGKAVKKYGWDGFYHLILADNLTKETAQELERSMILLLDLTNPQKGYNEAVGGGGGGMYGKHQSDTAKKRISEARKRDGFTEDHRKHISEAKSGIKHHFAKAVYQYTKDGDFIRKWDYMSQASKELGIKKTAISACCLGKRPSAGGYKWDYKERM